MQLSGSQLKDEHLENQCQLITAIRSCPREADNTFWQIEWSATNAGDTAIQNCPGFTAYYGKITKTKNIAR